MTASAAAGSASVRGSDIGSGFQMEPYHSASGAKLPPSCRLAVPGPTGCVSQLRPLLLLGGDRGADLVHVQLAHALDHLVERAGRQSARVAEHQNSLAYGSDGGNRADLERSRQFQFLFRVNLAEDDIGVGLGGSLVGRGEAAAGTAPFGPEVEKDDVVIFNDFVQVAGSNLDRSHGTPHHFIKI